MAQSPSLISGRWSRHLAQLAVPKSAINLSRDYNHQRRAIETATDLENSRRPRGFIMNDTSDFARLTLAVSDAQQYLLPLAFLGLICQDPECEPFQADGSALLGSVEVPPEIWSQSNVAIRDVDIKTTVLREVVAWILLSPRDVAILSYYHQLLRAYADHDANALLATSTAASMSMQSDSGLVLEYVLALGSDMSLMRSMRSSALSAVNWKNKPRDLIKSKRFPFTKKGRDFTSDLASVMDDNQSAISAFPQEGRTSHLYARLRRLGSSRSMNGSPVDKQVTRWLPSESTPTGLKTLHGSMPVRVYPEAITSAQASKIYSPTARILGPKDGRRIEEEDGEFVIPQLLSLPNRDVRSILSDRPRSMIEVDDPSTPSPHHSSSSLLQQESQSLHGRHIPTSESSPTISASASMKPSQTRAANADYFAEVCNLYSALKTLAMLLHEKLNKFEQQQIAEFLRKDVVRFIAIDVLHMVLEYAHLQLHSNEKLEAAA